MSYNQQSHISVVMPTTTAISVSKLTDIWPLGCREISSTLQMRACSYKVSNMNLSILVRTYYQRDSGGLSGCARCGAKFLLSDIIAESPCAAVDCVVGMCEAIADNEALPVFDRLLSSARYRRSIDNAFAQAIVGLASKPPFCGAASSLSNSQWSQR
jgi:hypothetical protein